MRRAGVAGQPGWRLVLNSEQREMGRFRREPAHCLCAAHQKRETQGGRGAAQQDEKAPEKIPAGGGHIKHPGQQGVPKGQAGGNGKEIEQDIAAAEEVDPPPPGIAAPIPKEGGDARPGTARPEGPSGRSRGDPFLCQNPQPEGGVALPVRQPPDTVQMKRPKEEEKQRLIPRDFSQRTPTHPPLYSTTEEVLLQELDGEGSTKNA